MNLSFFYILEKLITLFSPLSRFRDPFQNNINLQSSKREKTSNELFEKNVKNAFT